MIILTKLCPNMTFLCDNWGYHTKCSETKNIKGLNGGCAFGYCLTNCLPETYFSGTGFSNVKDACPLHFTFDEILEKINVLQELILQRFKHSKTLHKEMVEERKTLETYKQNVPD